jgi:hypothetical protein
MVRHRRLRSCCLVAGMATALLRHSRPLTQRTLVERERELPRGVCASVHDPFASVTLNACSGSCMGAMDATCLALVYMDVWRPSRQNLDARIRHRRITTCPLGFTPVARSSHQYSLDADHDAHTHARTRRSSHQYPDAGSMIPTRTRAHSTTYLDQHHLHSFAHHRTPVSSPLGARGGCTQTEGCTLNTSG